MCGCGCDIALALAGIDRRGCAEVDEVVADTTRAATTPVPEPTVRCWESFKLALHRVASERAAALGGAPIEPT
jgi:hypothetical protein